MAPPPQPSGASHSGGSGGGSGGGSCGGGSGGPARLHQKFGWIAPEIAPEITPARLHEKFGWYSQSTIESLRRLLKQSLQTLAKAQSGSSAVSTHALGQPTSRTLMLHSAPPPTSSAAAAATAPSAVVGSLPGTARPSSGAVKGTTVSPPAAMGSRMHANLGRGALPNLGRGALRSPVEAAAGSLAATA